MSQTKRHSGNAEVARHGRIKEMVSEGKRKTIKEITLAGKTERESSFIKLHPKRRPSAHVREESPKPGGNRATKRFLISRPHYRLCFAKSTRRFAAYDRSIAREPGAGAAPTCSDSRTGKFASRRDSGTLRRSPRSGSPSKRERADGSSAYAKQPSRVK